MIADTVSGNGVLRGADWVGNRAGGLKGEKSGLKEGDIPVLGRSIGVLLKGLIWVLDGRGRCQ